MTDKQLSFVIPTYRLREVSATVTAYLDHRLPDKRLQGLIRSLFRPSYGGNRNYTLIYTLGALMVSADDDMRPYSLMEHSPESLESEEVCRGRLHRLGENGYGRKSFDILTAFRDVLGKPVGELPDSYDRGELLIDSAMDLETNASRGLPQTRVNNRRHITRPSLDGASRGHGRVA